MRLKQDNPAPRFKVRDIYGQPVALEPFRGRRLLLSFYRFASCPFCNLRIHHMTQKAAAYRRQGLEMVAVFQSPAERVLQYAGREARPFSIVADPGRELYRLYGVETSWWGMARAVFARLPELLESLRLGNRPGPMDAEPHRLPADFLIDAQGNIEIVYYGKDIGDHLPLEQLECALNQGAGADVAYTIQDS